LFRTQDSLIYANPDASKYSLVKINEDYMTYVEGIETKYPGFTLDRNSLVVSRSPSSMDIEFKKLKEILLSPQKLSNDHDKLFTQTLFLKKETFKVTYTSYPRSGNTFLRKYFETITGIPTGSD
jgi:hypothetical protein